ncbi:2Fe-2S iron-sulfur cluster-binding protein [Halalkaliarchaeum sp. AArc-GB]|uniref:2Fe-2S iron-sulfur cluster-binding protein n=1 Tax=Halalkaliarchaeum sp. AArc-GB TaxID=3074078 RepID=UPI00285A8E2C|nr:2Fe-2S iron-sulfur cluster-binding protein [Halalkaliarchaeum sp. AArc-GB]MDR5673234.1 2Fe-2S iron-sulfur cluster-binding protein [Halalkaliarchaeum sp. AArc-GB]
MAEYTVEFVGTGERVRVSDTQTVLNACIEEGIAHEYSCRVGMCLACSARILEGEVAQPAAIARGLTETEAEEFALTCMARPQSDLRLRRGEYPPSIEGEESEPAAGEEAAGADD